MPVLLYQLWAFVSPGLTDGERRAVRPWIPLALRVLRPRRRDRLLRPAVRGRSSSSASPTPRPRGSCRRPREYFDFVTTMFLAFGLVLEFPILLYGLSGASVVLLVAIGSRRSRRMAILGISIFAAVATPGGDLVSPRVLGGTMYLLFEGTLSSSGAAAASRRVPSRTARPRGPQDALRPPLDCADDRRPTRPSRSRPPVPAPGPHVAIITGLSGGGKTAAAKLFEDLGYLVVDNLPGELLPDLADLVASDPERFARIGDRARRPRRRRVPRARRPCAARSKAAGSGPRCSSSRRATSPHPALLGDAPSPPAGRHPRDRQLHRDRAGAARHRPRRGRRRPRHQRALAAAAPREAVRPPRRRARRGPHRHPADQLRLQARRAAGGRPRVRRPVHAEPVLHRGAAPAFRPDGAGPRLRPGPAHRPRVPAAPRGLPRPARAGVHRRGQDAADDRHRVHGRLSTARSCSVRGARDAGCASATSGPCRVFHRELERA